MILFLMKAVVKRISPLFEELAIGACTLPLVLSEDAIHALVPATIASITVAGVFLSLRPLSSACRDCSHWVLEESEWHVSKCSNDSSTS